MMVKRLLERCHRLLPLPFASLLRCEVVVENTQRAIVIQCAEEVQGFKVVRSGFVWMAGADVKIAAIDQCVGDGLLIPFCALDREDFTIAGFSPIQVAREYADVAQIAERIGEGDPGSGDRPRLPVRRRLWPVPVGRGGEKSSRDACRRPT